MTACGRWQARQVMPQCVAGSARALQQARTTLLVVYRRPRVHSGVLLRRRDRAHGVISSRHEAAIGYTRDTMTTHCKVAKWTQHCAHSTVGSVQQCCERTSCLSASAILATPSPIPSLMQCCSCGVRANTQACCRRAVGIWACVSSVQLVVPSARTLLERYPFGHTCYCNSHPVEQACVATTLTAAKGGAADDGVGEGDLLRWVGDLLRRTVKHACQNRIACSAAPCVSRPSASAALVTLEIQRRGTERWRGMQTQRIGCGHCDTCVPGSRLLGCPPPPAAACAGRGCCSAHRQCRACS